MLKKLNRKKNQKGFTLVELLIVIAIIGILAAIAIPQFSSYRQKAYMAVAKSDAKNAYTALQAYISENPGGTPPTQTQTGAGNVPAPYDAARVSKDVTVTVTGTAVGEGSVLATHAGYPGYSYLIAATGAPTETIP
jgi:type IV pilus assembly protein PilA